LVSETVHDAEQIAKPDRLDEEGVHPSRRMDFTVVLLCGQTDHTGWRFVRAPFAKYPGGLESPISGI
jgi:hypothetical protein